MSTLGLGVFLSLSVAAGVMVAGGTLDAFLAVYVGIPIFFIAFATARCLRACP